MQYCHTGYLCSAWCKLLADKWCTIFEMKQCPLCECGCRHWDSFCYEVTDQDMNIQVSERVSYILKALFVYLKKRITSASVLWQCWLGEWKDSWTIKMCAT